MKISELTPDQKFLFVEICERGPNPNSPLTSAKTLKNSY